MNNNNEDLTPYTINALVDRGADLHKLSEIAYGLQKKYVPELTKEIAHNYLLSVLTKREVQHTILTAIGIDKACEAGFFDDTPLGDIIRRDEGLYGPDETLAFGITDLYGTIAKTNFGYLDIVKPSIIGEFNNKELHQGEVHTYIDDVLAAVVAAVCSKIGHNADDLIGKLHEELSAVQ